MAKKEKEMPETTEQAAVVFENHVSVQEVKQPVSVTNLDTGEEDKVTIVYKRYTAKGDDFNAILTAAQTLVDAPKGQAAALIAYASSQAYQVGKLEAFGRGNYLTPELKRTIVGIMQATPMFADLSAKDCFDRWSKGYAEKKSGALKLLAQAQTADEFGDL